MLTRVRLLTRKLLLESRRLTSCHDSEGRDKIRFLLFEHYVFALRVCAFVLIVIC